MRKHFKDCLYAKVLISPSDIFFFTFVLSFYILVEKTKLYLCREQFKMHKKKGKRSY